ncbi:putative cysteine protease ATG4 [Blattamonas nauphoetae]|uniref:Cysteine protease n=1 Tax=Blattamonas nauphoetae TaxID=2049346 RepID=A0ABQ9YJQ0_9EUKA|nr:putative cysteine protease ATG4 [Blattamonas nauphoetae]
MSGGSPPTTAYLLGHPYVFNQVRSDFMSLIQPSMESPEFKADFSDLFWLTYRKDFQPLSYTSEMSDRGWGCMHRTSQMMMAEAIRRISKLNNSYDEHVILSYFLDFFKAPFSIHRISDEGATIGVPVGQWFSPHVAALVMSRLSSVSADPLVPTVLVCHDTTLSMANANHLTIDRLQRIGHSAGKRHSLFTPSTRPKNTNRNSARIMYVQDSKVRLNLPAIPQFSEYHPEISHSHSQNILSTLQSKNQPLPPSSVKIRSSVVDVPRQRSTITFRHSDASGSDSPQNYSPNLSYLSDLPTTPTRSSLPPPFQFRKPVKLSQSPSHSSPPLPSCASDLFTPSVDEVRTHGGPRLSRSSQLSRSSSDKNSVGSETTSPIPPASITPISDMDVDLVDVADYEALVAESQERPGDTQSRLDVLSLPSLGNEWGHPLSTQSLRDSTVDSISPQSVHFSPRKSDFKLKQRELKRRPHSFQSTLPHAPSHPLYLFSSKQSPLTRRHSFHTVSRPPRLFLLPAVPQSQFHPILVLAPLRLGLQKINLDYLPVIQAVLSHPNSVGIVGGKPRLSLCGYMKAIEWKKKDSDILNFIEYKGLDHSGPISDKNALKDFVNLFSSE